jgi:hypothetical protein
MTRNLNDEKFQTLRKISQFLNYRLRMRLLRMLLSVSYTIKNGWTDKLFKISQALDGQTKLWKGKSGIRWNRQTSGRGSSSTTAARTASRRARWRSRSKPCCCERVCVWEKRIFVEERIGKGVQGHRRRTSRVQHGYSSREEAKQTRDAHALRSVS